MRRKRIRPERVEFAIHDFQGRRVTLRTGVWVRHILRLHPEMFGHQDEVKQALTAPVEAYRQTRRGRTDIVYWLETEHWLPQRYLKVVARVVAIQGGVEQCDIRTAHPRIKILRWGQRLI